MDADQRRALAALTRAQAKLITAEQERNAALLGARELYVASLELEEVLGAGRHTIWRLAKAAEKAGIKPHLPAPKPNRSVLDLTSPTVSEDGNLDQRVRRA
jgi:hypothetical protein